MSVVGEKYKDAQAKVKGTQTYNDTKKKYDSLAKRAGDSFENTQKSLQSSQDNAKQKLDDLKKNVKKYQKQAKNQIDELLDLSKVTGGQGSNSMRYIKNMLIKVLRKIEPKMAEILLSESLTIVGCDQQQSFNEQVLYIKVSSIDLGHLLKKDPETKQGKALYEKGPIQVQNYPFSMNRELYRRIQSSNSYKTDNGVTYKGRSGQPLFDIEYTETNEFGETGSFYKITLPKRVTLGRLNNVSEFIVDYYKTIKVVDFNTTLSWILEALTGMISISGDLGLTQVNEHSKMMAIIQRILGLCFDNRKTIDVSGISKLSEGDEIDESFFELTNLELRQINERNNNIKKGVVKFATCGDVELPVNADELLDFIEEINLIKDENAQIKAANNLTNKMANNPDWNGIGLEGNIQADIDLNFILNMVKGLAFSLFSPKVLLPLAIMLKALGKLAMELVISFGDFMKKFKKFFINVISKIAAIFVKELFNLIKIDIRNLIQSVITDLAKEQSNKYVIIILKLVQLLITIANFINDWRECKSVVDEILWLLKIATSGWGNLPLPLVFACELLDGFSETRAFIGTITELQKIGIPTGDMPDGSPNLSIMAMFSQLKGMTSELAENSKVQVAIPPLTMTPAGVTIPASSFGKML
jgi:hypothetical protein